MKKVVLTAGVSVLTTAAVCAGVVGVLSQHPSTEKYFDFTGKNQEIITELQTDVANKNSAIAEKDATISTLENSNSNMQNELNSKNDIILQKDSEISALQVQLDELSNSAGAMSNVNIPSNLNFSSCAFINLNEDYSLLSSADAEGSKGLYLIMHNNGEFKTLLTTGYNYSKVFKVTETKYVVHTSGSFYKLDLSNESITKDSLSVPTTVNGSSVTPGAFARCIGGQYLMQSQNSSGYLYYINPETFVINQITLGSSGIPSSTKSVAYNEYFIYPDGTNIKVYNGKTKTTQTIAANYTVYAIQVSNTGIVVISDGSNVVSTLNLETETITDYEVSYGFTSSSTTSYIGNGCFLVGGQTIVDGINGTIKKLGTSVSGAISQYIEKDENVSLFSVNGKFCTYDKVTETFTNFNITISLIEEMEDGNYKLISSDKTMSLIYNSVSKTVTVYSLIIE